MRARDIRARLMGVLTATEQRLIKSMSPDKRRDLLKPVRTRLVQTARPVLQNLVREITGNEVVSMHHDMSTTTGEGVFLFTLSRESRIREVRKK